MVYENKSSPKKYNKELPRVSDIVSFVFPFEGSEADERFDSWLRVKWVNREEYMEEASSWWTFVHKQIENHMMKKKVDKDERYNWFVESWVKFIKEKKLRPLGIEKYVKCKDYQWTCDLVCRIGREKWLIDWKNWGLSKYAFWIEPWKYNKPYSKLKKARLQLSLYAKVLNVIHLWVVELTPSWYYFHELEPIPWKELTKIIKEFNKQKQ